MPDCVSTYTSAIIIWQSKVPLPNAALGRSTCGRIMVTTGAPKVMFGTKWPSMISTCSQSAPCSMVSEHALPKAPKSALKIEGAIIAGGAMFDMSAACVTTVLPNVDSVLERMQSGQVKVVEVNGSTKGLIEIHVMRSQAGRSMSARSIPSPKPKPTSHHLNILYSHLHGDAMSHPVVRQYQPHQWQWHAQHILPSHRLERRRAVSTRAEELIR